MSKEQILGGYLNTVYFGRGAYGDRGCGAGVLPQARREAQPGPVRGAGRDRQSPATSTRPSGSKQAADLLERFQYVLKQHGRQGGDADGRRTHPIYSKLPKFAAVKQDSRLGGSKGFLLNMVKQELLAKGYTDEQICGGGLKVGRPLTRPPRTQW